MKENINRPLRSTKTDYCQTEIIFLLATCQQKRCQHLRCKDILSPQGDEQFLSGNCRPDKIKKRHS